MPLTLPERLARLSRDTWATTGNGALAKRYDTTRQVIAYHRDRLGMPSSPENPGGDRLTPQGSPHDKTTAVINCTKGQKRRWMQAKTQSGLNWDTFAAAALDAHASQYQ